MHYALELAIPVVCVDSPLFEVDVSASAELGELRETSVLVTSVRPGGWPMRVRSGAPRVASSAHVLITNREGLVEHVLPGLVAAAQVLQRAVRARAETSAGDLFDATVRSAVLGATERWSADSFRSDLDASRWAFIDVEHLRPLPWLRGSGCRSSACTACVIPQRRG